MQTIDVSSTVVQEPVSSDPVVLRSVFDLLTVDSSTFQDVADSYISFIYGVRAKTADVDPLKLREELSHFESITYDPADPCKLSIKVSGCDEPLIVTLEKTPGLDVSAV